jgi:sugar/nucleoside kinase (ribokinase family)
MPAYVIVSSKHRSESGVDAVICDLNRAGGPDHKSAVPVRVEFVNERVLAVDGQSHEIVSTCGAGDSSATYLINFTTQRLRNRARRLALARSSAHLQQLRAHLLPLKAGSEHPQLVTEGLKLLATWLAEEDERLNSVRSTASG